ncbi:MAG: hypothetical protein HOO91_03855 [Bacteroidales bacterium]|nr:hypothetical protein [Bacteroidales bacterium]
MSEDLDDILKNLDDLVNANTRDAIRILKEKIELAIKKTEENIQEEGKIYPNDEQSI